MKIRHFDAIFMLVELTVYMAIFAISLGFFPELLMMLSTVKGVNFFPAYMANLTAV